MREITLQETFESHRLRPGDILTIDTGRQPLPGDLVMTDAVLALFDGQSIDGVVMEMRRRYR
jgi:hypothetical protein